MYWSLRSKGLTYLKIPLGKTIDVHFCGIRMLKIQYLWNWRWICVLFHYFWNIFKNLEIPQGLCLKIIHLHIVQLRRHSIQCGFSSPFSKASLNFILDNHKCKTYQVIFKILKNRSHNSHFPYGIFVYFMHTKNFSCIPRFGVLGHIWMTIYRVSFMNVHGIGICLSSLQNIYINLTTLNTTMIIYNY